MNKFNTKGGLATTDAWSQPHMSKAARVKVVGRMSIAELQAMTPKRYKRKKRVTRDEHFEQTRSQVPAYVMKNEVKRWAKHKGVETQERGGYTIMKLG